VHTYGPVPSRRLGYSLGVDIAPYKTCTLDCIYCQLGPTTKKTVRRSSFFEEEEILAQIRSALSSSPRIDFITFSGSGEPTLNKTLGLLIREIKKTSDIPVAVLTNSTLLTRAEVRKDLWAADLVVPSLDAATQEVFRRLNHPHPSLSVDAVIRGLIQFRRQFKGKIWLEILLVRGVNDSPAHLRKLREAAEKIHPDRIHLNTVVRPPAQRTARPLSLEEMRRAKAFFGKKAEIVAPFDRSEPAATQAGTEEAVMAAVRRRPMTLPDLAAVLGRHPNELLKVLDLLLKEKSIRIVHFKGEKFYEPGPSRPDSGKSGRKDDFREDKEKKR